VSYLLSNEDSAKHKNKCKNQEEYNKEKGTTSISMVFGNEMCQTLAKQPENDGIEAIYRGLPSF
jgi:hypothetical protein